MTAFQNLEQLKWWHIRSLESTQTIEAENWKLRRTIVDLRQKSAERENEISTCVKQLRDEVEQIKSACFEETEFVRESHETLKKSIAGFLSIISQKQETIVILCDENERVTESLTKLKTRNFQDNIRHQRALEKSESKALNLKENLLRAESAKSNSVRENGLLREEVSMLASKNEMSAADSGRLKAKLSRIESDCQIAVSSAKRGEGEMRLLYDELVLESEARNARLVEQNTGLQNEVLKLQADIASRGNVSQFAKFVQLKSENIALKSQLSIAGTSNTGKLARIPNIAVASSGGHTPSGGHFEKGASSAPSASLFSDVAKGGTPRHHSGGRRKSEKSIAVEFEKTPSIVKDKVSAIEKHTTTSNVQDKMMTAHGEVAVRHYATRKQSGVASLQGPAKTSGEREISMGRESNKKQSDSFAHEGPETSSAGNSPPPMGMGTGMGTVIGVDRDRDKIRERDHPEEKEGSSLSRSSSYKKLLISDFSRSRGSAFKEGGGLLTSLSSPSRFSTEGPCSDSSPQVTPHDLS